MIRVLHLLPRVPPAVCGIGDYAWGIARGLSDEHAIHSQFLSAGTSWTQPDGETEFQVNRLPVLSAGALERFVNGRPEVDTVVLHMSPYGYQKRAVPLWMASAWRQLALRSERPRLITMFHELYASGPVRSSAFWLQPLQKWVLRRVARASDALRTNRQPYADWLLGIPGLKTDEVEVMPVYSNFGEPKELPSWENREPAMAMFAWGIHSGESLDTVVGKAAECCRRFGLCRLHLIGWKKELDESGLGVEVVRHGFLKVADISRLLQSCRMAYTAYSPIHFGKSTLMAAFAAHGLVVITQGKKPMLPDGLEDGRQVLHEASLSGGERPDEAKLQSIGRNLRSWYDGHSLAANVRSYATQVPCDKPMTLFQQLWQGRERPPLLTKAWCKAWAKRLQQLPALVKQWRYHGRLCRAGACIDGTAFFSDAGLISGKLDQLKVGPGSFIGRVELSVHAPLVIGSQVCINDGVKVLTASHVVLDPEWPTVACPIEIGDHAWIATNALILLGVKIGRGAVVGAGAVVTQDVPEGGIVAGNPARLLDKCRPTELRYSPTASLALFRAWCGAPVSHCASSA